jgi:hypothetical protein
MIALLCVIAISSATFFSGAYWGVAFSTKGRVQHTPRDLTAFVKGWRLGYRVGKPVRDTVTGRFVRYSVPANLTLHKETSHEDDCKVNTDGVPDDTVH